MSIQRFEQQQSATKMEDKEETRVEAKQQPATKVADEQSRLSTITEADEEATINTHAQTSSERQTSEMKHQHQQQQHIPFLTLIYASMCLLVVAISSNLHCSSRSLCQVNAATSGGAPMLPPANEPFHLPTSFPSALSSLSLGLLQQLAATSRERWTYVPNPPPSQVRDQPTRLPPMRNGGGGGGGGGRLSQAISRLTNRIGARNTIRVHNAFRDFAWRVLSRLSMPTPVIYELRRQHLYSPLEDSMNDSLHGRNTSRTIRTKRLLDWISPREINWNRSDDADAYADDDDDESLREKFRSGLFEIVRPSRRSLLGSAFRLPNIFPFKRQEVPDDKSKTSKRRNSFMRRRRRKETDRQLIMIDGKQYYVDDDGKLKELKEDEEVPDRKA